MLKNLKCLFSGQHLKQRIIVFVSITKIVSDFYIKLPYLVLSAFTVRIYKLLDSDIFNILSKLQFEMIFRYNK